MWAKRCYSLYEPFQNLPDSESISLVFNGILEILKKIGKTERFVFFNQKIGDFFSSKSYVVCSFVFGNNICYAILPVVVQFHFLG